MAEGVASSAGLATAELMAQAGAMGHHQTVLFVKGALGTGPASRLLAVEIHSRLHLLCLHPRRQRRQPAADSAAMGADALAAMVRLSIAPGRHSCVHSVVGATAAVDGMGSSTMCGGHVDVEHDESEWSAQYMWIPEYVQTTPMRVF